MKKTQQNFNYFINLGFFLYFLIILVERLLSFIIPLANGMNMFEGRLRGYGFLLTILSIVGFIVYLCLKCRNGVKALAKKSEDYPFFHLIIASGILLIGAMVHTPGTISWLQFVGYAPLIAAIALQAVTMHKDSKNKLILWLSFAYLISFSMAVPVVYQVSGINHHFIFHAIELGSSILLVAAFTFLTILLFKGRDDLFFDKEALWLICPVVLMVALDVTIMALGWKVLDLIFLLVFVILTAVLFIAGTVIKLITGKKAAPKAEPAPIEEPVKEEEK